MGFGNIFDNDPDAPKSDFVDDIVGRFRSGAQVNRRPLALQEWRITTGDPTVADALADLLGGSPQEWETESEERLEVYTEANSVAVILDGPSAVSTSMVLWGQRGKIRECDGATQRGEDGQPGEPCACPSSVKDRKAAAEKGTGCQPSIGIYFRLADLPDLGRFKYFSGSWSMAAEIGKAEEDLAKVEGPALGTLSIVEVKWETPKGSGKFRQFYKPVLKITGPAPAEEG